MKTTEHDSLSNIKAFFPGVDRVCAVKFEDNAPPWRNDQLWQVADNTLYYLMYLHGHQLDQVKETAGSIKGQIESIDGMLDWLCKKTCAQCSSPCCLVADVSYDFKDLLFIHLTEQENPPGQPRRKSHDACRYLGDTGCLIPRLERPWICTWYICAEQKNYLAGFYKTSRKQLLSVIEQVKMLRKQMEDLFVTIVAP
jgi:hypothetical protein